MKYKRFLNFKDLGSESAFLWGPRQTGKTTLLKEVFPEAPFYNLLISKEFERLSKNPSVLSEELLALPNKKHGPVIIDEVQKLPMLLDEVQNLITQHGVRFILSGSSARKLKRGGGNLLGGRALRYELFPLVYPEITDFNLVQVLNRGAIPRHYQSERYKEMFQSYIGDYLKEEIMAEALTRNIQSFHRFLEAASFSNGEMIVYEKIASECGVKAPTVKAYFQILEDTLIGKRVPSFQKRPKRKVIQAPKFYFFDVGIVNYLLKRSFIEPGSELFGRALEHYIFMELTAYLKYTRKNLDLFYWRTTSQIEVDFIISDPTVAIEVKATAQVQSKHLRALMSLQEEYTLKNAFIVSLDLRPRKINNVWILPVEEFLKRLWAGEILNG